MRQSERRMTTGTVVPVRSLPYFPVLSCLIPSTLLDVRPSYIHGCLIADEVVSFWGPTNRFNNHLRGVTGHPQARKRKQVEAEEEKIYESGENVKARLQSVQSFQVKNLKFVHLCSDFLHLF